MERNGLKLVERDGRGTRGSRPAFLVGTGLLVAALLATAFGAGAARDPVDSLDLAQQALVHALERGNEDPGVRETLLELRESLRRRPLDSGTRVIYAGLLLSLCRRLDDTRAPAFHADLAARLSPVTVPIVVRAALVLARSREADRAVALTREMFEYDPDSAASLLSRLENVLFPEQVEAAVAPTAEATLVWSRRLRELGRIEAADAWLLRGHSRWPDHLPTLQAVASAPLRRGDWDELERLLPPDRVFPDEPAAAPLLAYRARLAAERGDAEAAARDADRALALARSNHHVLVAAGDALEAAGDHDRARSVWNRALFELGDERAPMRRNVLLRLARLEDRYGRPATALRLWRSVLDVDPAHGEARRRVDELSGFHR